MASAATAFTRDADVDAELLELEALLAINGGETLSDFIARIVPTEPPPPHLAPLIELIERAQRERVFACVSWPPRHAKTVTILRGIAWWLARAPADLCAYVSYSDSQARSKSRLARGWTREAGVELARGSTALDLWHTKGGKGGCISGGAGGGLTGKGVSGLMVVDDPYKNRQEADSGLVRGRIWEWFNDVVYTRLQKASVIVVHTRWHEDDIIGRLSKMTTPGSKRKRWEMINLPALAEEDDILGRNFGEALWPEQFDAAELGDIKAQLGDWAFSSLYQGRPRPRGENVFREPARWILPKTDREWAEFAMGKRFVIAGDPAASERTHADYSAAVLLATAGIGDDQRWWVLGVSRKQCTIPVFVRDLRMWQDRWKCAVVVESVGGFKSVSQMLRHVDPNLRVTDIAPRGDKLFRSQPCAAAWNAHKVYVPTASDGLGWVDPFLAEVLSFSGVRDAHDDQVDALAHAFNATNQQRQRAPRGAFVVPGSFG